MKALVLVSVLFAVGIVAVSDGEEDNTCYTNVEKLCETKTDRTKTEHCSSLLSNFAHSKKNLAAYVDQQLASSYKYLLLGTHFDNYQMNRPGFHKLFRSLSDKSFEYAIDLIKHVAKRGGFVHLNSKVHKVLRNEKKLELDELYALSLALDNEKILATEAHRIHEHASSKNQYDPEVAAYIEEEFLPHQTETIRKLAGYANDVASMAKVKDTSLAIFLFDEYLQKQ